MAARSSLAAAGRRTHDLGADDEVRRHVEGRARAGRDAERRAGVRSAGVATAGAVAVGERAVHAQLGQLVHQRPRDAGRAALAEPHAEVQDAEGRGR